jgi:hypothetical protein
MTTEDQIVEMMANAGFIEADAVLIAAIVYAKARKVFLEKNKEFQKKFPNDELTYRNPNWAKEVQPSCEDMIARERDYQQAAITFLDAGGEVLTSTIPR